MKKIMMVLLGALLLLSMTSSNALAVTYYTLTVKSTNPLSGVAITVSPNDRYGRGNGTTQFTRSYASNTSVTLTAPAAYSGKSFQKWKKGYSDYSTNQSVSITMTGSTTMTAVYISDTTAPTGSVSINSGAAAANSTSVTLALVCSDANGCSQMQFSDDNSTWSTAEAYAAAKTWTLSTGDGTKTVYAKFKDTAGNWSAAVSDTITLDATAPMTAATPAGGTFTGSSITVALSANEAGTTYYCTGAGCSPTTAYTAPLAISAYLPPFNIYMTSTTLRYYSVDSLGNSEVIKEAVYNPQVTLTINYSGQNCNGCSGANITISPADINGQGDGVAAGYYTLTRTYAFGTPVTLTAPERVASDGFQQWTIAGLWCPSCIGSFSRTATFTMTANATATAAYAPTPVNLTLTSSNPTSGASIRVQTSPLDSGSLVTTTANPVTLAYTSASTIYLTALLTSPDGHTFQKWQKNGVDYATTASISVQFDANAAMTAVYATPTVPIYTLTATSINPWNDGRIWLVQQGDFGIYLDNSNTTRKYPAGTVLQMQAQSSSSPASDFQKWLKDGVDYTGTFIPSLINLTMNADAAMTAVWGPKLCRLSTFTNVSLWALMAGPGPWITISPSDDGHNGNGYDCGTSVTLSTGWGGCNSTFSHWQMSGGSVVPGSEGNSTISLTLNDPSTTVGPVFNQKPIKVYIASDNPDSGIDVSVTHCNAAIPNSGVCVANNVQTVGFPVDFWGTWIDNNFFWCGHTAALTAPETSPEGHVFQKWLMNGQDYATSRYIENNKLYHDMTLTAVYTKPPATPRTLTLTSSNPDSDVKIAVSPKDTAELANGTAPFTRTFDEGSVVTLAAPSRAGSNVFRKWQKDGTDYALSQAVSVTMSADVAMTAVYSALTSSHASLTWTGNYAICQQCHMDKVNEVHNSLHYQWQGDASKIINSTIGLTVLPAQPIQGKIGSAINAFCINILGNFDGACGSCHVGLGKRPDDTTMTTQQHLDNIDCLLCHQKAYKRKKDAGTGKYVPDTEKMTITMDEALRTLHKPERVNCLQCHAKAGGGDAVKRGDLAMATGATADRHYDVHMATTGANLECQACHTPVQHKFPGRGSDLRPIETDITMSCSTSACHSSKSGPIGHKSAAINHHIDHVACQTCHIPVYAKNASDTAADEATEMSRDWRTPEWSTASSRWEALRTTANDVQPTYKWFDGRSWAYNLGEEEFICKSTYFPWLSPADQGLCAISGPWSFAPGIEASTTRNYKLTAFKYKTAWQPMSTWRTTGLNELVPLSTKKYFETGDYDAATREGSLNKWGSADLPYTTVQTYEYLMLNHQVSPAADSVLQCASCHTTQGVPGSQVDLQVLLNSDAAVNSCSTCHGQYMTFPKGSDWTGFHNLMKNGPMKTYGCARCHRK